MSHISVFRTYPHVRGGFGADKRSCRGRAAAFATKNKRGLLIGSAALSVTLIVVGVIIATGGSSDDGVQIIKSENDHKDYRYFVMPNELSVLLISDPTIEAASAQTADGISCSCWPWARQRMDANDEDDGGAEEAGTKKAAFALAVGVGYLTDPKSLPGCAHYVEHMLFMGTEKYPNPDDFNVYMSAHGGATNAFTTFDRTVYYFNVQDSHLEGAVDRWSEFFKRPLF